MCIISGKQTTHSLIFIIYMDNRSEERYRSPWCAASLRPTPTEMPFAIYHLNL